MSRVMEQELVYAIPRKAWDEFCHFEGFLKDQDGEIYNLLLEHGGFRYRHEIETDHNYKQVIPQGLIKFGDSFFVNERLPKQTESRLNYFYSLGFGGHLNIQDSFYPHINDLIQVGLHREMGEEVSIPVPFSIKYVGLTNIEEGVSAFHVGVWFEISIVKKDVAVNEHEKMNGFWVPQDSMNEIAHKFESWADLIYKNHLNSK